MFVLDDIMLAMAVAAATGAAGAGVNAAVPKYGMTDPSVPPNQPAMMDFQALLNQGGQSKLPQLQLQNRLPQTRY
jgi:hypothetical protein